MDLGMDLPFFDDSYDLWSLKLLLLNNKLQRLQNSATILLIPAKEAMIEGEEGSKWWGDGFILEYIRYMANLLVSTANADE